MWCACQGNAWLSYIWVALVFVWRGKPDLICRVKRFAKTPTCLVVFHKGIGVFCQSRCHCACSCSLQRMILMINEALMLFLQIKDRRYGRTHVAIYGPSWAKDDWCTYSHAEQLISTGVGVNTMKCCALMLQFLRWPILHGLIMAWWNLKSSYDPYLN